MESFAENFNRLAFQNAAEYAALYPGEPARTVQYCAPRVEEGSALHAVWLRLAGRGPPGMFAG